MKRCVCFSEMMKAVVLMSFLITACLAANATAQGFSQNVMANSITSGNQDTDGGNVIAVNGNNVYVCWNEWENGFVYVSRSTDGGTSFGQAVKIATTASQSFPSITLDSSGNLYGSWSNIDFSTETFNGVEFSKSTDGGQSFSTHVVVDTEGLFPIVAVHGSNVYMFYAKPTGTGENVNYYFARSTDGGSSFGTPYKVNDADPVTGKMEDFADLQVDASGNIYAVWNDGRRTGGGIDIYFAKSTDDGVCFGTNVPVNDLTAANADGLQFGPALAVSPSGDIYVVWREEVSGEKRIYFGKSTDGGATFGSAVEVSAEDGSLNKTPSIAVTSTGEIYVAYPSFKNGIEGIYITKSEDGGQTFVSSVPVVDFTSGAAASMPSIVLDGSDKVFATWTDNRSGDKDVYFAKGEVVTAVYDPANGHALPSEYRLMQNYPNPFNAGTVITYSLPMAGNVKLVVYNLLGQEIKTLVEGDHAAGVHTVSWDGRNNNGVMTSSGIYLFRMVTSNGLSYARKMVIIK